MGWITKSKRFLGIAPIAVAAALAVGGFIGCGGGGGATVAKADAVVVTYYYLPL